MKNIVLTLSLAAVMVAMAGCQDNGAVKNVSMDPQKQEREFVRDAIRHRSPDVQRVDIVDSTVVYTHIFDGIIDVKTYTYDGDMCVQAERVYTFPNQMSALRHYRDAIEKADLYESIEMFDKQIADAKADMKKHGCDHKCDAGKDCHRKHH